MNRNTCLTIAGAVLVVSGVVGCHLKVDDCGWLILFGIFSFMSIGD